MPPYRARVLVLRKTKLGETDVILTLLSEDGGIVRAVAKGMRKPGSRFGGRLEPFSVADAMLHTGRSLDVVSEVESVKRHQLLQEDFDRSAAASVVVDVLDKLCCEGQEEGRLFGLGVATLDALESADAEAVPALVTGFLLKAMALHGLKPELRACSVCCGPPEGGERFSIPDGGILCPGCSEGRGSAWPFDEPGREILEQLLAATMEEIRSGDYDGAQVSRCFALVDAFVRYHVPSRLKALEFFAGVNR